MNWFNTLQIAYIFRIIVACICGVLIGLERKNRAKEAGIRTHCIVACGASLMMIISKYGFFDIIEMGLSFDCSRVAAQIISGVGFLGAGTIFVHKNTVTGLTTAAGIWATAGIGMALGAGMYPLGIASTIIILIIQILLHRNSRFTRPTKMMRFSLHSDGEANFQKRLYSELEKSDIHVYSADVSHDKENNIFNYIITLELPPEMSEEELVMRYDGSRLSPV